MLRSQLCIEALSLSKRRNSSRQRVSSSNALIPFLKFSSLIQRGGSPSRVSTRPSSRQTLLSTSRLNKLSRGIGLGQTAPSEALLRSLVQRALYFLASWIIPGSRLSNCDWISSDFLSSVYYLVKRMRIQMYSHEPADTEHWARYGRSSVWISNLRLRSLAMRRTWRARAFKRSLMNVEFCKVSNFVLSSTPRFDIAFLVSMYIFL